MILPVTNKVPSPVLIKRIKEKVRLEGVEIKANVYTKRKIKPLEWAVIAPVITLDPRPPLEEIAKEFGIEKVEFLTYLADQMEVDGVLIQNADGSIEVTPRGKQLYDEGMMICYPQKASCLLFHEPITREWLTLLKLKDHEVADKSITGSEIRLVTDEIRVPPTIVEKYLRHYQLIKKEENVVDYNVQSVKDYYYEVDAGIILKPDTVDVIVSGNTFGDYTKMISATLKGYLFDESRLKMHLSDIFEFESRYGSGARVQTMDLGDSKVFSPLSIENMFQELRSSNPKWVITRMDDSVSWFMQNPIKPRVVLCHGNNNIDSANTIFPPVVLLHLINAPDDFLVATDKHVVTLKTVTNNTIEVPMLIVEPNTHTVNIGPFLEEITLIMDVEKVLLAKTYLKPDTACWDDLCKHLLHYYGKSLPTALKIADIIELKASIGISDISPSEEQVYDMLIEPSGFKELVIIDNKIIIKIRASYLKRLEHVLRHDISNLTIKEAIGRYSTINDKFNDKTVSELHDKVEKVLTNYLLDVVDQINNLKKFTVEDDIENTLKLLEMPAFRDKRDLLFSFITQRMRMESLSADKAIRIYQKLSSYGYKINKDEANRIGKQMLEGFKFSWAGEETHKKITMVNERCKSIYPGFNISSVLDLPVYTGDYYNKKELVALIDNIFTTHVHFTEIDQKFVVEKINKIEVDLRQSITPDFFERWLTLIGKAKAAEKIKNKRYLNLSDADIVKKISVSDKPLIDLNKNLIKSMGLWDQINKVKNDTVKKDVVKKDHPPMDKIIVDGSNVARYGLKNKSASSGQLIDTYKKLLEIGFTSVNVFIGASLRHSMSKEDYESMIQYFDKERERVGHVILLEAPAKTDDDYYIIKHAIEENALILTDDKYQNHQDKNPSLKDEMKKRRVTFMIISGKVQIGEYPEG